MKSWGTSFYPYPVFAADGLMYAFNDQGLLQVNVHLPGS